MNAGRPEMKTQGVLFVVATPIGNLGDLSARAREVLATVSVIVAEDTRHTGKLLQSFNISTRVISLHEHNESQRSLQVIRLLQEGQSVALVSDAGTPLISDPGYRLLREAVRAGITISPVPGACAAIAALSVAALPSDHFCFEGFLPPRSAARRQRLQKLAKDQRTVVLYEAPHRLRECLEDLQSIFGPQREAVIARELTKTFETIYRGSVGSLLQILQSSPDMQRGEIVLLVAGAEEDAAAVETELRRVLSVLLEHLTVSQAADAAAKITGASRNHAYKLALHLSQRV